MKLLGWMHRKFRQNISEPSRDLATAPACLYCVTGWPSPDDRRSNHLASVHGHDSPDFSSNDLIDSLLSIGTFGSPIKVENGLRAAAVFEMAEEETEITRESELITFAIEFEKVLRLESGKGKEAESIDAERRSERRASLGELFMKSRAVDADESIVSRTKEEVNRKFKGHESLVNCTSADDDDNYRSRGAETRIQNILRIFHRKIHPENCIDSKKLRKQTKFEVNREHKSRLISKVRRNSMKDFGRQSLPQKEGNEEEKLSRFKSHSYQDSRAFYCHHISGNREQWIKTDADYHVLEL